MFFSRWYFKIQCNAWVPAWVPYVDSLLWGTVVHQVFPLDWLIDWLSDPCITHQSQPLEIHHKIKRETVLLDSLLFPLSCQQFMAPTIKALWRKRQPHESLGDKICLPSVSQTPLKVCLLQRVLPHVLFTVAWRPKFASAVHFKSLITMRTEECKC